MKKLIMIQCNMRGFYGVLKPYVVRGNFLMYGIVVGFMVLASTLHAQSTQQQKQKTEKKEPNTDQILQCNAIFESRKDEITQSLRSLNEKMQNLEAYKNATQNLLDQKEAKLKDKERELESKQEALQAKEQKIAKEHAEQKQAIDALIAKNETLLKEIKEASTSKVAKTFAGMKDAKAAPIIAELDDAEAAGILSSLSTSEMAKILAKMDAKRAAELTKIISKGPPFTSQTAKTPGQKDTTSKSSNPQADQRDNENTQNNTNDSSDFQAQGGI